MREALEVNKNSEYIKNSKKFLEIIPKKPGVYIFKDSDGNIVYIGKAKNLYKRVRSYFKDRGVNFLYSKPPGFTGKIKSIDYVVTDSETEALILESNLIKKNKPRYNIELKDDKSYPFIAITEGERFPRVFLTRNRNIGCAKYFGPYTDVRAVRKTVDYLGKIFKLRDCKKREPGKGPDTPCLNYYINLCRAPCIGKISPEEYGKNIKLIELFLKGKDRTVIKKLNIEMKDYSDNKKFEKAQEIKDRIDSINRLHRRQKIFYKEGDKWDFLSAAGDNDSSVVSLFIYRSGKLALVNNFTINNTGYLKKGEILSAFIRDYYGSMNDIPDRIFCEAEIGNKKLISEWLESRAGKKVKLIVPKIGEKRKIMDMACRNSAFYLEKKKFEKEINREELDKDLVSLKEMLGLSNVPRTIECYDISNLKDTFPVGSMSVAVNGKLENKNYRHFKIRSVKGQDDCGMIKEVITRRLKYIENKPDGEKKPKRKNIFSIKPDLLVIDGGKAQYNVVKNILGKKRIKSIDVISIAKREEVIFCEKYPDGVRLDLGLRHTGILIKVRDEAHRFAVKYHRKLRDKHMFNSILDGIKGIGERKKKNIFEHINSAGDLKSMTVKDLMSIKGLGYKDAINIYRKIRREKSGGFI
ncbi:MAG: excinuclease ABC subunit UvrC [Actinomycetota bacterium]|nr:excinuclease ABC subunit UvrC [Actinomycetota bacterium]